MRAELPVPAFASSISPNPVNRFSSEAFERFRTRPFEGLEPHPCGLGLGGELQTGRFVLLGVSCGDALISKARYQTFNCVAAIAAADWLCETVEGRSAEAASQITALDIIAGLGGLPPRREFCAHLAYRALQNALAAAEKKGRLQCKNSR